MGEAQDHPLLDYLWLGSCMLEEELAPACFAEGKKRGHQNWTLGCCGVNVMNRQKAVSWAEAGKASGTDRASSMALAPRRSTDHTLIWAGPGCGLRP